MRTCFKCGIPQDESEFYKDKRRVGGISYECKTCSRARSSAYRQKNPEKKAAYRQQHAEEIRTCQQRWNQKPEAKRQSAERRRRHRQAIKGTWEQFFETTWNGINVRTENGAYAHLAQKHQQSYIDRHIRVEFTRAQYKEWCQQQSGTIEEMYRTGQRPSIDRIDSDGNYAFSNVRVLPLLENCGHQFS